MADQSHILKLKATLDTSDVQKKLNQLRNTQQNALKGSDKAGQNNINLGGLTSTLTRLNQTMMSMQRTLQLLIRSNNNNNNNNYSYSAPSRLPFTPALPPYFRNRILGNQNPYIQSNISAKLSNKQIPTGSIKINPYGTNKPYDLKMINEATGRLTILRQTPNWTAYASQNPWFQKADPAFNSLLDMSSAGKMWNRSGGTDVKTGVKKIGRGNVGKYPKNRIITPTQRGANLLGGPLFGFAAGAFIDQIANYLDVKGFTGSATATRIGGGALTGASWGRMLGPYGMAAGAIGGALFEVMDKLIEKIDKLNKAYDEQLDRIKSAKNFDIEYKNKMIAEDDSRRLAVGDKVYFKNRINFKQGILNKLNKQQEEIGIGPGALTAYEQDTLAQINEFKKKHPNGGELPEYIKRRQRLADRYKINVGTIDQVKSDIERYKGNLKSLGVYSEDEQELIDFKKRVPRDYTNTLEAQRHVWQGDVDRLEKKKAYWQAYSEETGKPIDLKALEDLEKELNSYKDKIAAINDELNKREEILKEQKISWLQNDLNNLQDRLSNLKNPNMSNVNSLAQFGFGISKNDDAERLKMQTDYQKQQVDLQREIRDKVKELDTIQSSATFS